MFRRVLIANRGEIALRIVRACRALGVESIAVYSEADRGAPWLEEADRAVCIGPARADRSYLDQDAILQAAEQTDAQALHPGYGFLAENARFAARCEQQGLRFVGPSAEQIRTMGDKSRAKITLAAAGLPTIPGSPGIVPTVDDARIEAKRIGYPVLLKASAGGGGKGMRLCRDPGELETGFRDATLESGKAFGNSALYLEKFILGGRHVEFQILCDHFGNGIHLGERDCSVQRRHQKLIEESPSPAVDATVRSDFGRQVAQAVAGLGYRNAGTVEFLRDSGGRFYFMEMNTRLQVEHPVSEMVTGVDLVAEQLRVAANQPLRYRQEDISLDGHAIEFRINAEDPENDFRPDPGEILEFKAPPVTVGEARVRWDSAIRKGYRIPPHYDSMVGKLIVHAATRQAALDAAGVALDGLQIEGIRTTKSLQRRIVDDPTFRGGDFDIHFLANSGILATPTGS